MGLMYMKSLLACKPYHEGSVVAEAGMSFKHYILKRIHSIMVHLTCIGSEHCDSEGHDTDLEQQQPTPQQPTTPSSTANTNDSSVGQNSSTNVKPVAQTEQQPAEQTTPTTSRPFSASRDQVELLKELLKKQGKEYLIIWLQQILLDTCQVKLNSHDVITTDGIAQEAIPFHYNCM